LDLRTAKRGDAKSPWSGSGCLGFLLRDEVLVEMVVQAVAEESYFMGAV
jgi:hypothetical protein